jgi:hypothetical protein
VSRVTYRARLEEPVLRQMPGLPDWADSRGNWAGRADGRLAGFDAPAATAVSEEALTESRSGNHRPFGEKTF